MSEVAWDDVRLRFDPESNGVLPDVHVPDTSVADWQQVFDLVRSKGWAYQYEVDGRARRVPHRIADVFDSLDEVGATFRVWPVPGMLANFFLRSADQVDFDVDLRELQGQQRLDVLCGLMRAIGRRLRKSVIMTDEGIPAEPILGYDAERDRMVLLDRPGRHGSA